MMIKFLYKDILLTTIICILYTLCIYIFNLDIIQIVALTILAVSIYNIYRTRKNRYLLLLNVIMLYFTYGIVMGEYLLQNNQPTFNNLRSFNGGEYYNRAVIMLFIFIVIYSIIIRNINYDISNNIKFKDNSIIFICIYILLIYIGVFCIDRVRSTSYSVNISSAYEYSYILFIFLCAYTNNERIKKYMVLILACIFIIQDFYYGGRITSIQIMITILSTLYIEKINLKQISIGMFIAIIIMNTISVYRVSYSIDSISLGNIIENLTQEMFVDDTATHAYGASITHIAGSEYFSIRDRINSFLGFILSIFLGGGSEITKLGNVTSLVHTVYTNVGGGIIFSHFYFWLGNMGLYIAPLIVGTMIIKLLKGKGQLSSLMLIGFITSMPRWYLYTPLALFRVVMFFIPIGYILCILAEKFLRGVSKIESITN